MERIDNIKRKTILLRLESKLFKKNTTSIVTVRNA